MTQQAGYTPNIDTHIILPSRHDIGGSLLDQHAEYYIKKIKAKSMGSNGTRKVGFGMTSDGTTRFGRGVIDVAFVFKSGEVVFWSLEDVSGERKTKEWLCDFILRTVRDKDFPLPIKDLVTIVMDGACRTSFPLIEEAFKQDEKLPNVVCQWCSTHSLNLMMKAIADIDGIATLIDQVCEYITFVRSHDKPRALARKFA